MIAAVVIAAALAAGDAETTMAAPARSVSIESVGIFALGRVGDVLVPVEVEAPLYKRLRFVGRVHAAMGTGAGAGIYGAGLRLGVRWYPFSDVALSGFFAGLQGGADMILTTYPVFGGIRPTASVSLGYSVLLARRVVLTPGIELHPVGMGFPTPGLAVFRLGVGMGW